MMADNIEHVISYWVIFQTFHSPLLGGFAVISHWLPHLLFAFHIGGLADRLNSRKMILVAEAVFMVISIAWGALFLTHRLAIWHAMGLLAIHGLAGALWSPPTQLITHEIVGPQHLQSAVRLNATARQLGILLGPAVGGTLMLVLGPAYGLMVNALLYLPLMVWLLTAPYTGLAARKALSRVQAHQGNLFQEAIWVGRRVSGNSAIVTMIVLAGLSSLLIGNAFQAQMPQFAGDLGTDKSGFAYSALLAANAAGAVLGGFVLELAAFSRARQRTATILAILWCVAIGGFAAAPSYSIALTALFLAGVFNISFMAMCQTLVQVEAPADIRGRVIGLFNMAQQGLRVGSGLTVGVLGSLIGIHWSLGLSAAALASCSVALLAVAPGALRRTQGRSNLAPTPQVAAERQVGQGETPHHGRSEDPGGPGSRP